MVIQYNCVEHLHRKGLQKGGQLNTNNTQLNELKNCGIGLGNCFFGEGNTTQKKKTFWGTNIRSPTFSPPLPLDSLDAKLVP